MSNKEIAEYTDVSQFETGESAYECGFFAVALQKYAGRPGTHPLGSAEDVDQLADKWYIRLDGLNIPTNKNGMSLHGLYYCLSNRIETNEPELRYHPTKPNLDYIRAWVKHGYPVLITVQEDSVFDVELGDKVPYGWKPSGSHILTVSGIAESNNLLCRDTASIATTGLRPQPREYDADKLQISAATVVILPFLATPPTGFDPTREEAKPIEHPQLNEYTIRPGDTLADIASRHGVPMSHLINENWQLLDEVARSYGYLNSNYGNLIFPVDREGHPVVLHW